MKLVSTSVSAFLMMCAITWNFTFLLCVATYSVQKLVTFSSSETNVVTAVQCVFAVNAPARGCFVVFSNISFTFNETIIRFDSSLKVEKAVTIPNTLPSNIPHISFNVAAYDYYLNQAVNLSNPAVVLYDEILLTITPSMSPTSLQSTEAISSAPSCMLDV